MTSVSLPILIIVFIISWLFIMIRALRLPRDAAQRRCAFWLTLSAWPLSLGYLLWSLAFLPSRCTSMLIGAFMPVLLLSLQNTLAGMLGRQAHFKRWPYVVLSMLLFLLSGLQGWRETDASWLIGAATTGDFISYWPLYLSCLLVSFAFIYAFIGQVEQVQQYHHELPLQVVDPDLFKLKGLVGSSGFAVSIAFILVLLVVVIAFEVLAFANWMQWFHLGMALALLVVISQLTRAQNPSPLPFDHVVINCAPKMSEAKIEAVIQRAEETVITQRSYKQIGLTLSDFATQAGVSPSELCLALLAGRNQHFRGFIYQFRMKYAKQLLFSSDANLDNVAKRLKLGGSGALNRSFMHYLERRQR